MNRPMIQIRLALVLAVLFFGVSQAAYAASSNAVHVVTVSVPTVIGIQADTTNFTLTFADFASGAVTDQKTVIYTVKANNVTRTTGVVQAKLSTLFTNVNFRASAGAYTKTGGNANLVASTTGFVTVGTAATNLYNRQTVSGTGAVVLGNFPVTFQGTATADLSPSSSTSTLTVTFIDT